MADGCRTVSIGLKILTDLHVSIVTKPKILGTLTTTIFFFKFSLDFIQILGSHVRNFLSCPHQKNQTSALRSPILEFFSNFSVFTDFSEIFLFRDCFFGFHFTARTHCSVRLRLKTKNLLAFS